jgi:Ca2+-binding EF-hand superfamily protein
MIPHRKTCLAMGSLALVLFSGFACSRRAEPINSSRDASRLRAASGTIAPTSQNCMANFRAFDRNNDGSVSGSEFMAMPHDRGNAAETFAARDASRDGVLNSAEFCSTWTNNRGVRGTAAGSNATARGAMRSGMSCRDHFVAFDTNANGNLSLKEFSAWPHIQGDSNLLFSARDRDHNGVVTQDEFCSAWSERDRAR